MNHVFTLVGVLALLELTACSADAPPESNATKGAARGTPVGGKADQLLTCAAHCGGKAPTGCWCDAACTQYGDCCPDKIQICDQGCPPVAAPAPNFCPDGNPARAVDDAGCVTGFSCCPWLSPPGPNFCPHGEVKPIVDTTTGCLSGFECVGCPWLSPPGPNFCPDGSIETLVDHDSNCTTGFKCLSDLGEGCEVPEDCQSGVCVELEEECRTPSCLANNCPLRRGTACSMHCQNRKTCQDAAAQAGATDPDAAVCSLGVCLLEHTGLGKLSCQNPDID